MKKILFVILFMVLFLVLANNCNDLKFNIDCIKIGATEQRILDSCGTPNYRIRFTYEEYSCALYSYKTDSGNVYIYFVEGIVIKFEEKER